MAIDGVVAPLVPRAKVDWAEVAPAATKAAVAPLLQPLVGYLLDRGHQSAAGVYTVAQFDFALLVMPLCLLVAVLLGFLLPAQRAGR